MLDIDNFKNFNDNYGHAAGDRCLGSFGETLLNFTKNFRLNFYRYGGEEFLAMAYGYEEQELFSITESLRIAVQTAGMDGYEEQELFSITESLRIAVQTAGMDEYQTTVSIGVVYCGGRSISNYEHVIDQADKAVYAAKDAGRNQIYTVSF